MIRINLLPFRAARKSENIRRQVSLFFLSLVLLFLVMGYLQIFLTSEISKLNREVESTNKDLQHFQKQAAEVDVIKGKLDNLQKRIDVIKELDQNRKEPAQFLEAMTNIILPGRMWLRKLNISDANVKISGLALDQKTTADFMVRLEESKLFTEVNLETIRHEVIKKQKLQNFEITCIKPPKMTDTKAADTKKANK